MMLEEEENALEGCHNRLPCDPSLPYTSVRLHYEAEREHCLMGVV